MKVTVPLCVYFLSLFLWLQAGVDKIKSSNLGLILFSEENSDMVTNGVHRVGRTVRLFRTHWKESKRNLKSMSSL